jgi:hypothetical protein
MVDQSSYPFGVLIWSVPFGFDSWEEGGRATVVVGATGGLHGGGITGDRPERCFDALKLTVRSQGGVGEDGEAGGDIEEALEGRR